MTLCKLCTDMKRLVIFNIDKILLNKIKKVCKF